VSEPNATEQGISQPEEIGKFQGVLVTEETFARPLQEVWPVFKDIASWYTEYTWEVESGPGYASDGGLAEGQRIKVTSSHSFPRLQSEKVEDSPEYFVTDVLKVVPESEIVSSLSGRAFDWERFTSFYVWRLAPSGEGTKVTIESYTEVELSRALPVDEYAAYREELNANWFRSWSTAFAGLSEVLG